MPPRPPNAAKLARMRAEILALLTDTCVLSSPSYSPNGMGGGTITYTAAGTVVGRLDNPNKRQDDVIQRVGKEGLTINYVLTLPYDATIDADWRVTVNGQTYEIIELNADHSMRVVKRAYIARVK